MANFTKRPIGRPPGSAKKNTGTSDNPLREHDHINGIPVEPIGGGGRTGTGTGNSSPDSGSPGGAGGFKPAAAAAPKTSPRFNDLNVYSGAIQGVSDLAAFLLKLPELGDLDDAEALKLAKAIRAVQVYHPSIDITGEALAWIGLCAAISQVYGTRVAAITLRKKTEREEKTAKAKQQSGPIPFGYPATAN
jgi:hypothetical protein